MRRQVKRMTIEAALTVAFLSLTSTTTAWGQTRVRLATLVPHGSSIHHSLQAMGEAWRQAPGGVTLTIYTDGTMGSEPDMVRRMRVGQIQAATLTVGGLSEIDPAVSALQKMPMMFHSLDEVDFVRSKLQPELEKRLLDKGFVVLFWGDAGWVRFFSKQPALRPEEFKPMKVFVTAGDKDETEIMKAAGYKPVPLEWSDALTSLRTGLIDAVPTLPFYALAGQFDTAAPHMLEVNWVPLVGATIITKKAWDAIPGVTQEALLRAAAEAGRKIQARNREESNEAVEAMRKRGLRVHALSPQDEAEWRRFAAETYPKVRGRMVPAEMFDEVEHLLLEYRSSQGKGQS